MPVHSYSHLLILKCSWTQLDLCQCVLWISVCTEYWNKSYVHVFSLTGSRSSHRVSHRSITCISEHNECGSCVWEAKADRWSGPEHATSVFYNYKKGISWISFMCLTPKHGVTQGKENTWLPLYLKMSI